MRKSLFALILLSCIGNNTLLAGEMITDTEKSWEQKTIPFYADSDSPGIQALKGEPVVDATAWSGKSLKFKNENLQWVMTYPWKKTDFQQWAPYPWKLFTLYARIKVKHAVKSPEGVAFACGAFGPGREGRIEKMVMASETENMQWQIYEIARFLPNDQSFYIAQANNRKNISEIYLDCIFFTEGKTTGKLWFSQGPSQPLAFDSKWMAETSSWPVTDIGKAELPPFGISCLRKEIDIPESWKNKGNIILNISSENCQIYWNGFNLARGNDGNYLLPENETRYGNKNILALKIYSDKKKTLEPPQISLEPSVDNLPNWTKDSKTVSSSDDSFYKAYFRMDKNQAKPGELIKTEFVPVDRNGKVNPFLTLRLSVNGSSFPMQFDPGNNCYTTWLFSESTGTFPIMLYQWAKGSFRQSAELGNLDFAGNIHTAPDFFPTGVFYCAGYLYRFAKEEKDWSRQLEKVFKDMRNHGIDTIVAADFNPEKREQDRKAVSQILDITVKENMKVILFEGQNLDRAMSLKPIDLYNTFLKQRNERKSSKNILACQIWDEINMPDAENWHFVKGIYEGINPEIPVYCWLNKSDSRFIEKMKPSLYCRDTYMFHPSTGEGEWTGEFEQFLNDDSAYADKKQVPFWIALSAFGPWGKNSIYRMPTPEEIVLQSWMSVAAGAKGIFYFTYFIDSPVHMALVNGKNEKPIAAYESLGKFLNEIFKLKPLLLKLKTAFPAAACEDSDIMLRTRSDDSGNKYLFIVNKNLKEKKSLSIKLTGDISVESSIDLITGEKKNLENSGIINCTIPPADGKIYKLEK